MNESYEILVRQIVKLYNDEKFSPLIKEVGCNIYLEYIIKRGTLDNGTLQLSIPEPFPENELDLLVEYMSELTLDNCKHIFDSTTKSNILEISWQNDE